MNTLWARLHAVEQRDILAELVRRAAAIRSEEPWQTLQVLTQPGAAGQTLGPVATTASAALVRPTAAPAPVQHQLSSAVSQQVRSLHAQATSAVAQIKRTAAQRRAAKRRERLRRLRTPAVVLFSLLLWLAAWQAQQRWSRASTELQPLRTELADLQNSRQQVQNENEQREAQVAETEKLVARAESVQADLRKKRREIADKQAKLDKSQEKSSRTVPEKTLQKQVKLDKSQESSRVVPEKTRQDESSVLAHAALPASFGIPAGDKNAFGHPVVIRDGSRTDAETGLPLEIVHRATGIAFVWIPPGEFEMGAREGETDSMDDEHPRHRVRISRGFWVSRYEITQGQYQQVLGKNPSYFSAGGGGSGTVQGLDTSRFPVEDVDWNDCIAFANKLGEQETPVRAPYYQVNTATVEIAGGDGYRLLTEAEWEYAARAGTTTIFPSGDSLSSEQANFSGDYPYGGAGKGKYLGRTAPVGIYPANPWGLYDTAGNVWEWVWDRYGADEYKQFDGQVAVDPQGPAQGVDRALRGGCWNNFGQNCRPADRRWDFPGPRDSSQGFRLALGWSVERAQ